MGGKGLDGFMGTKFLGFALGLNLLKKSDLKTKKNEKKKIKKKLQEHPEGEAELNKKTSDSDIDGWTRCIYASSKVLRFFLFKKKHLHTILPKKIAQTFFYGIQKQFQMKFFG